MSRISVREEMRELVLEYKSSEQSRARFSADHGISTSKLSYWVNYYNKMGEDRSEESGSFVHVGELESRGIILVRLPNGIEIESEDLPWSMVEKLLNYVGE